MILPKREDAIHKVQLLRLLTEMLDDVTVSQYVYFKGGTCAAMLSYLNRFSIDLDFDLSDKVDKRTIGESLQKIFKKLDLIVDKKSPNELFYILKYQSEQARKSLKLRIVKKQALANVYKVLYLPEIDRFANCQSIETMFSHKLVSLTDRYKRYTTIAGRDLYDIHHFFLKGYSYIKEIIVERTGKSVSLYLVELQEFIEKKIKEKAISEDLNYLLSADEFQKIRKILKKETLILIADEIKRQNTH